MVWSEIFHQTWVAAHLQTLRRLAKQTTRSLWEAREERGKIRNLSTTSAWWLDLEPPGRQTSGCVCQFQRGLTQAGRPALNVRGFIHELGSQAEWKEEIERGYSFISASWLWTPWLAASGSCCCVFPITMVCAPHPPSQNNPLNSNEKSN